ncbi:DUF1801 domain-containing protein [Flammeovirga aprica]|uniref:DUF1801 domain-containing protein n=1 Tax=Flammeovirga aprica JL-4 TaxID=694437 RepID=A0A7X9RYX6_9BACT|nr:DUF1801 domain-containing protein [Flammeovirga aprica]NME71313.1 DUF1801 domain-containing protein [Flammeovirga aprica JL-4]
MSASTIKLKSDPAVLQVFENYPNTVKQKMHFLRTLVIETAEEMENVASLEETLKWGEPSYVTKHGSTLRMDWKSKTPDQYAMYFQCSSRLVETFQSVFGSTFQYEGKRAIVFDLDQEIPIDALRSCIKATLQYHKVKDLFTLGM